MPGRLHKIANVGEGIGIPIYYTGGAFGLAFFYNCFTITTKLKPVAVSPKEWLYLSLTMVTFYYFAINDVWNDLRCQTRFAEHSLKPASAFFSFSPSGSRPRRPARRPASRR